MTKIYNQTNPSQTQFKRRTMQEQIQLNKCREEKKAKKTIKQTQNQVRPNIA